MSEQLSIDGVVAKWIGRRGFAKTALLAGAGVVAAGSNRAEAQGPGLTDADILNFALNLEYLEAEFYTIITAGVSISAPPFNIGITGTGTPGPTGGLAPLTLTDPVVRQTAIELAYDEREHVRLLRTALGSAAVAKPAINFAAAGVTSVAQFLRVARVLEDVGVSAYAGAAPLLTTPATLGTAARILAAEANHSGAIRLHSLLRAAGNIGPVDANDIVVSGSPTPTARLFHMNAQGLAPIRTPSQVLSIVYGPGAPAGTSAGLLFPNGLNGTIRTV